MFATAPNCALNYSGKLQSVEVEVGRHFHEVARDHTQTGKRTSVSPCMRFQHLTPNPLNGQPSPGVRHSGHVPSNSFRQMPQTSSSSSTFHFHTATAFQLSFKMSKMIARVIRMGEALSVSFPARWDGGCETTLWRRQRPD